MSRSNLEERPELLFGPNPLIEALPPFIPFENLPSKLTHYPLDHFGDWRQMGPSFREPLLEQCSEHFAPFGPILEPAAGIQLLLRRACSILNPLHTDQRRRVNQVSVAQTFAEIEHVPTLEGGGGLIDGITGLGKTRLVHRILDVIAPEQVIEHEPCPAAGWLKLTQCVYLYVDHASNGTRGAVLKRVLLALDEKLGTNYAELSGKSTNLDTLLTRVCKYLVLHRIALLVIDEKQERNFDQSPWQMEFILFYLSLMNLGISVLLVGNPAAFYHLEEYSQVMRRFSMGGKTSLMPASNQEEGWWCTDFVPRERKFCLVEKCLVDDATRAQLEFEASAGIPGLFQRYYVEAQRSALRRGDETAELTLEDFTVAKASPRYKELAKIAVHVNTGTGGYQDIPELPRSITENNSTTPSSAEPSPSRSRSRSEIDVVKGLLTRYRAEQTRNSTLLNKRLDALTSLSEDDLRMLGVTQDLLHEAETSFGRRADSPEKKKAVKKRGK
ncbi:MAG: ATP-binding protein [Polaromonas sp.]|nr:ATP-binding protein [Polaromonas sp.]